MTNPAVTVPDPPFSISGPGALKISQTLTPAQRAAILNYIAAAKNADPKNVNVKVDTAALATGSDRALIGTYFEVATLYQLAHNPNKPALNPVNIVNNVANAGKATAGAIEDVGQFLGQLANPHLWLRVGEVLLGLILVGVGIAVLSKEK